MASTKPNSNTKPKSKSKSKPVSSSTEKLKNYEQHRKVTFHANVFNRTYFEKLTFEWQEKLFEPKEATESDLALASRYLCPKDYLDVLIERNAAGLCGYPLCSKPPQNFRSDRYLSARHQKMLDLTPLKPFCSKLCFGSSRFYEVQLSTEPVYLRKLDTWSPVEVIPFGITVVDYMKLREESSKIKLEEEKRYIEKQYIHKQVQKLEPKGVKQTSRLLSNLTITSNENVPHEGFKTPDANSHAFVEGYKVSSEFESLGEEVKNPEDVEKGKDDICKLAGPLDSKVAPQAVISKTTVKKQNSGKDQESSEDSDDEDDFDFFEPCKNPMEAAMNMLTMPMKGPPPKLNLFGKMFLFLDHCVTPCSKNYLKHLQNSFTSDVKPKKFIVKSFARDDSVLLRRDMISKILLVKWVALLQDFQVQFSLKQELIEWVDTLDIYEPEMGYLNSSEALCLCLILLKKLSLLFPPEILGCVTDSKIDEIGGKVGFDKDRVNFFTRFL